MKVLFVCDWDFTYLWEKVARRLLDSQAVKDCSALVIGRIYKEHLDRQKDKVFSSACLLQNMIEHVDEGEVDWERLKALEEKYADPTLWRYVWADRSWVNSDYEVICKRLIATFDFYEAFYNKQKPDLIVTPGYGSMPHLIGNVVARNLKIPMYRPLHTRIEDRYVAGYCAMERVDWIDDYLEGRIEASHKVKDEVERFIEEFRSRPVKPDYESVVDHYFNFDIGGIYRYFRYIYRYCFSGSYGGDHSKPNPVKKLWMELAPRIRRRLYARAKFWDRYVAEGKYIYFPLHLQPEYSTMTLAPYYLDQISVIANLAKSVPVDVRIVVKEHPFMLGRRDVNYYREIQRLPNVDLVHPFTDNFQIIQNANMVFTITGTAALEAAILGRPAVMLGAGVHSHCPSIAYAGDIAPTKWPKLIEMQLNAKNDDEDGLRRFLGGLFERGFRCSFMEPLSAPDKVLADENVEQISNVLAGEIEMIGKDSAYGRQPLNTEMNCNGR